MEALNFKPSLRSAWPWARHAGEDPCEGGYLGDGKEETEDAGAIGAIDSRREGGTSGLLSCET